MTAPMNVSIIPAPLSLSPSVLAASPRPGGHTRAMAARWATPGAALSGHFTLEPPPPRPQENLEQIRRGEAEPVRKARHVFPATGRLAQGCGDLPKQSIGTSSSRELRASQGQAGQARAEGAPASASRPQRTSASKRPASERRLGKQEPILGLTFPGCSLARCSFR